MDSFFSLLPEELLHEILLYLAHPRSILAFVALSSVNKQVRRIAQDPIFWLEIGEAINLLDSKKKTETDKNSIFRWYEQNKPLCWDCGSPALRGFPSFAQSFVVVKMMDYFCSECSNKRKKQKEQSQTTKQSPNTTKHNKNVKSSLVSSRLLSPKKNAANDLERKEQLEAQLHKLGIKGGHGPEWKLFVAGKTNMSASEVAVVIKKKHEESENERKRRQLINSKKREMILLQIPN
jgi:hypothetical protein